MLYCLIRNASENVEHNQSFVSQWPDEPVNFSVVCSHFDSLIDAKFSPSINVLQSRPLRYASVLFLSSQLHVVGDY